ncbi:MAG: helix-turn-helix transcriptional regulator [Bacteroidales bacterium]|nr:helix-turn-helix transcriptional regulator [Bacteroidales bacterium]
MNLNNEKYNSLIINKIENLRKSKLLNQTEIAKKIGMSLNGYNKAVVNGDFKLSTLTKIANVLGVPVSYFFEESGKSDGILNGNQINGSNNNVSIKINQYQNEIDKLKQEVNYLKEIINQKDEIINLLKNK